MSDIDCKRVALGIRLLRIGGRAGRRMHPPVNDRVG